MRWNKVVNLNEGQTEKTERNSRENAKAAKRRVAIHVILYCYIVFSQIYDRNVLLIFLLFKVLVESFWPMVYISSI